MRLERRLTRLEAEHYPDARLVHGWTALVGGVGPGLGIAPEAVPTWARWLAERAARLVQRASG